MKFEKEMAQNTVQIIVKGEDQTSKIREWNESNGNINITYSNGKTYTYNKNNVLIKHSALANEIASKRFQYLKSIAQTIGLNDPQSGNILANRYNKINFVDEESIFAAFLSGKIDIPEQRKNQSAIYPFGFNISQKTAIDNALLNPLSIIEGPPGTGKTQTILNIIANVVMANKSVAVVSSNNSATANVYEKLEKYQLSFIAAYLGNSENKAKFVESQQPFPDMAYWKQSADLIESTKESLQKLNKELSTMLEEKNKLSQVSQELEGISLEYKHFNEYCTYNDEQSMLYLNPNISSDAILEIWIACEKYIERGKMPGLFKRFINHLLFGILDKTFYRHRWKIKKSFYSNKPDGLIMICQKRWFMAKIDELAATITQMQTILSRFNFDEKMAEYSTLSLRLFRNYLTEKYNSNERRKFELYDLYKNSEAFINEYPVILSTTYSLQSSLSSKIMYDYVIIDESSQVDIATGALALSCAKNAVIVGDLKQLPNVVNSEDAEKTDAIFKEFDIPEVYRYKDYSLLLSLVNLFPNAPRKLLREHYRCHPKIIEFCNQKFYENQLIILTEPKSERQPLVIYKTVPGNHARAHINQRQIDVIKNEIIPQQNLAAVDSSIGIVTPYRNQTNALQNAFSGTGILADTVDKFQGRENDVIILSTVDNEISQFTDNANRLNVAVSRAIEQLIVVVSSGDDMKDKNIGDLVRYVEYNNLQIINSNIHSIFDNLYKSYNEKRISLLLTKKRVSEYKSENLMYELICRVLKENKRFMKFDVAVHVPLRMILRDMGKLTDNEKQYAQNYMTHVDFLIFDKIGKMPRLVVEVDGTRFHAEGTRQAERDKLKNGILEKYELPYKRFKTNESCENERLIVALDGL